MRRFRHATTETAGFYNTVGFNDDTRAFLSIPRGTMWRGASTAAFWRKWWPNTASPIGKRPKWRKT
jgi:glucuronate isomerase